jgi:hypothetical protein
MQRLRMSMDNGVELSADDERRLVLWEETGQTDINMEGDSMAMMLYQGGGITSRLNQATMRNMKAMQMIDKIHRTKIEAEE